MKKKSIILISSLALAGIAAVATISTNTVINKGEALPTQTTRRVFTEIKNTGWDYTTGYMWVFTDNKAYEMTQVCQIDEDDYLYYIDLNVTQAQGGFLYLDPNDVVDSKPKWSSNWQKSEDVASGTIPTFGEADLYLVQGVWESSASVTAGQTKTLTSSNLAALLSNYTSCGSDASYTNGIYAYPQLQSNFNLENYLEDTTPVNKKTGGEKNGTTLGKKIATMKEEYIKAGGTVPGGGGDEPTDNSLRILHCFDWSLSNIQNNLNEIKEAGFNAIQTSPLQFAKDYNYSYAQYESENWWKLYQPLSFTNSGDNWLGNRNALKALTTAANSLGIKVIVDVVANHMGSGADNYTLNSYIGTLEPDIYNHNAIHPATTQTDNTIKGTVWGNIGVPDLDTSTSYVQTAVKDYLKELIDDGVNGFRFDAAKHIETSRDGTYASTFWQNTLGVAKSYAEGKSKTIFAYGEILGTAGNGRNFSDYTDYAYMDAVTDNVTGNTIRKTIVNNNTTSSSSYNTGLSASKNILWAESHDTYMNHDDVDASYNDSQTDIDASYALIAARNDANLLYFTRPSGRIGTPNSNHHWTANIVKAANNFHSYFQGKNEKHTVSNSVSVVERYGDGLYGAVLVNTNNTSKSVTLSNLQNGTYKDLITGTSYSISNKSVTIPANKTLILQAI